MKGFCRKSNMFTKKLKTKTGFELGMKNSNQF